MCMLPWPTPTECTPGRGLAERAGTFSAMDLDVHAPVAVANAYVTHAQVVVDRARRSFRNDVDLHVHASLANAN